MGIKFLLRLQAIPFCFHAGEVTCDQFQPIKVIRSDGDVEIYDRPVNAAEVMSLVPKHLVCRSDSFYIGRRIPSLSADDVLLSGDEYFLLPHQLFQDDLSFVAAARMLLRRKRPFDVQRDPDGALRVRVTPEEYFVPRVAPPEDDEGGLCTTKQLKKDYSSLVGSTRQWKPKLETIKEEKKKRKISYTSSFKFRSHKSSPDNNNNKDEAAGEEKEKENNDTNNFIDDNALRDTRIITTARKKA